MADYDLMEAVKQVYAQSSGAKGIVFPSVWIPLNNDLRMLAGNGNGTRMININGTATSIEDGTTAVLTRTSTATYIDKDGVLKTANNNEPRFEKNGLLIEGQSTNLCDWSNDFATPKWNLSAALVIPSSALSPSLLTDATKLVAAATTAAHYIVKNIPAAEGDRLCFSVFVKAAELRYLQLISTGITATLANYVVAFDLDKGVVSKSESSIDAGITPAANGYLRCWMAFTKYSTNSYAPAMIRLADSHSVYPVSFTGDGVSGVHIYGAQLESLPFATSYIPTSDAQVTRAADRFYIPKANNNCSRFYTESTQITPIVTASELEFKPPTGSAHLRNLRGYY